jgi:hypothetical protein
MKTKHILSLIVAIFAIVAILPGVTAQSGGFVSIDDLTVDGIQHYDGETAGVFAGDVIPVRVTFTADEHEEDVRVVARILGERGLSEVTERFDVIEGSRYSRLLTIGLPYDLDDNLNEPFTLKVTIESNSREGDSIEVFLEVQRSSYELEILSVEMDEEVRAGDNLVVDAVLKNRGSHEAEDTFVIVKVPELGLSKREFLGDLSSIDEDDPEKFDSEQGRIFLRIPRDAAAGVYTVEVEAFNDDSRVVVDRRIVVLGASDESTVISSTTSKKFAVGEVKSYTLTLVNAGDRIKIYELVLEAANGLTIDFDESVVAVPAGTSRTVKFDVTGTEDGTFNFAVDVISDGELVKKQNYVAMVEGRSIGGDSAVLLTVVLAIVFVVLLVVLIVLLTRKPEKSEEFGESYY